MALNKMEKQEPQPEYFGYIGGWPVLKFRQFTAPENWTEPDGYEKYKAAFERFNGIGRWKRANSMEEFTAGTVVRNVGSDKTYLVTANYGSRATAVRSVDLTNPSEWEVLK